MLGDGESNNGFARGGICAQGLEYGKGCSLKRCEDAGMQRKKDAAVLTQILQAAKIKLESERASLYEECRARVRIKAQGTVCASM